MKTTKLLLACTLFAIAAMFFSSCGSTPVNEGNEEFAKYYTDDYWYRNYTFEAYNDGFYKANYVQISGIQEKENKDILALFQNNTRVDYFYLDGTKLYVGWNNNFLTVISENKVKVIEESTYSNEECNFFKYTDGNSTNLGVGVEKEIELNNKKYVCAFGGVNTNSFGFRMWVKDGPNVETAVSKPVGEYKQRHYDTAAYCAGVYKAGWTQLWSEKADTGRFDSSVQERKFVMDGENIYVGMLQNHTLGVMTEEGSVVAINPDYFKYKCIGNDGKKYNQLGIGWESRIKLNGKKYVIAAGLLDGNIHFWLKDSE